MSLAPGYLVTTVTVNTPTGSFELKAGVFISDTGLLAAIAGVGGQTVPSNAISDAAAAACTRARARGQNENELQAIMMAAYTAQTPAGETLAGNVTGPINATVVGAIGGASPVIVTPSVLEWAEGTVAPMLTVKTRTSDAVVNDLVIQSQGPVPGAVVNTGSSNLVLRSAPPAAGGLPGAVLMQIGGAAPFSNPFMGLGEFVSPNFVAFIQTQPVDATHSGCFIQVGDVATSLARIVLACSQLDTTGVNNLVVERVLPTNVTAPATKQMSANSLHNLLNFGATQVIWGMRRGTTQDVALVTVQRSGTVAAPGLVLQLGDPTAQSVAGFVDALVTGTNGVQYLGSSTDFANGVGVVAQGQATTNPTTNPTASMISYVDAAGVNGLVTRSKNGVQCELSSLGQGVANTQLRTQFQPEGVCRTTAANTPVQLLQVATVNGHNYQVEVRANCRAVTAAGGVSIGDTRDFRNTYSVTNVGGVMTLVATFDGLGGAGNGQGTASLGAASLPVTFSGTTIVVSANQGGAATNTNDWEAFATITAN